MSVIFELSKANRRCAVFPDRGVHQYKLSDGHVRKNLELPEVAEVDLVRHYMGLSRKAFGVDNGFYPLGSCTMKYNPKINEEVAALEGFNEIHPLQPASTVKGALKALKQLQDALCDLTGMDAMTLKPAAGAHGEFTGMQIIRKYFVSNGMPERNEVIIPDSAHGTNPASAAMNGLKVVAVKSNENGGVDLESLQAAVGEHTAALMLTNPNTLGLFDENIQEITRIVHEAGGLCYYDGANLNAVMGLVRPGDIGFDVIHLNLHKTFATPHGGGGPGSGPVGCKSFLAKHLPEPVIGENGFENSEDSIGSVRSFYCNFLVCMKALTYIKVMGADGLKLASENAVLNANYLLHKIKDIYDVSYDRVCMHEFVLSLQRLKDETGVSAKDVAKALLDFEIHPPTMYFPLIVHEALMFEPTETESRETLDRCAEVLRHLHGLAYSDPEYFKGVPHSTVVSQCDEVRAARNPVLRYEKDTEASA
ncbi:MAG: aminomethyl-transferring glycine dehydrogenase subunit GcvPB [Erysipelotrichaceae bacterium]|nr:aminomethyl-transferring glycine dehydrogenase subunit GcvPB [Erysipelotrichaceae bacterium]